MRRASYLLLFAVLAGTVPVVSAQAPETSLEATYAELVASFAPHPLLRAKLDWLVSAQREDADAQAALRAVVTLLRHVTAAEAVPVSPSPRTHVYRLHRPRRGPVYLAWSETGPPPPGLDYSVPNGETVLLSVGSPRATLTHVIAEPGQTQPETERLDAPGGALTLHLGYSPVFVEPENAGLD